MRLGKIIGKIFSTIVISFFCFLLIGALTPVMMTSIARTDATEDLAAHCEANNLKVVTSDIYKLQWDDETFKCVIKDEAGNLHEITFEKTEDGYVAVPKETTD